LNTKFDNYRYNDYIDTVSSCAKTRPGSTEANLFVAFLQVADIFVGQAEQVVKTAGLTGAQYNVLRILRGSGEGLACKEIGERMISRDPDITRLLDRMEKRGLITRERQSDDRRVVKTCVTAKGLELLRGLDQPVRELHKRQFQRLNATRLASLAAMLEQIRLQQARSAEQVQSGAHIRVARESK
jgi:MarR family transcriptional regulator, organic hydroperoxide resistance regulator